MADMGSQTTTPPNEIHFGYIVELEKYAFDEAEGTASWIQAFPYGEWSHPEYGKIRMDADRAARMAAGVNQGVRGQDLPINYDHGEQRKDAAGWVQRADVRPDGLWLFVDWTREAFEKIKNKAYKYFSPEYANRWEHPASGQQFKDVMFGGALTNMPHLKGILPLNLAEYAKEVVNDTKPSLRKFLEAYATLYGIKFSEDTTDEVLGKEVSAKLLSESKAPKPPASEPIAQHINDFELSGSVMMAFCEADWSSVESLDFADK